MEQNKRAASQRNCDERDHRRNKLKTLTKASKKEPFPPGRFFFVVELKEHVHPSRNQILCSCPESGFLSFPHLLQRLPPMPPRVLPHGFDRTDRIYLFLPNVSSLFAFLFPLFFTSLLLLARFGQDLIDQQSSKCTNQPVVRTRARVCVCMFCMCVF